MTIIEKLVEKYELTNETTIVKEDPFFKKKIQGMASRVAENEYTTQHNSPHNFKQHSSA